MFGKKQDKLKQVLEILQANSQKLDQIYKFLEAKKPEPQPDLQNSQLLKELRDELETFKKEVRKELENIKSKTLDTNKWVFKPPYPQKNDEPDPLDWWRNQPTVIGDDYKLELNKEAFGRFEPAIINTTISKNKENSSTKSNKDFWKSFYAENYTD